MAVTQYIGARYVPVFADPVEWTNTKQYEPLTIVLYQGNSFTSKQFVPIGIDINDTDYWALTGNYNAQVELYRQETANVKLQADATDALIPKEDFDSTNTVKKYIDDSIDEVSENLSVRVDTTNALIPKEDFDSTNTVKKYIDDSIDEVNENLSVLENSKPINVLTLGFDNTGVEDITELFNEHNALYPLYFPCGTYRVDGVLSVVNSIIGGCASRLGGGGDETIFAGYGDSKVFDINGSGNNRVNIKNVVVVCHDTAIPVYIEGDIVSYVTITGCRFENFTNYGIYQSARASGVSFGTRCLFIDSCMLYGRNLSQSVGIMYGARTGDNRITNVEIMRCNVGIEVTASYLYGSNLHIWCGSRGGTMTDALFDTTCAIRNVGGWVYLSEVYTDTCRTHIYNIEDSAKTTILNHCIYGDDSTIEQQARSVAAAIDAVATMSRITIIGGQYIYNQRKCSLRSLVNSATDSRIRIVGVSYITDAAEPMELSYAKQGVGSNCLQASYNIPLRTATGTNEYIEVARFEHAANTGGNVLVAISPSFDELMSIINLQYNSSTCTAKIVSGPAYNIYYTKKDGNKISIYQRLSNVTRGYNVSLLCSSMSIMMFNPFTMPDFEFDRTFDSTDMTVITA